MNRLVKVYNGTNTSGVLLEEDIHDTDGEKVILRKIYNSSGAVIERQYYPSENSVYIKNLTAQVNITRVYHNGNMIAENTNGVALFTITDHKGNVVAVANSTGAVIENTSYGPYGDILSGGTKSRVDYEAKTYSSVLKSYDFNFRKYNPAIQLFEQPDTIIQNVYDPQGLNHYSFERNNPMKNKDSTGHFWQYYALLVITVGDRVISGTLGFGYMFIMLYNNEKKNQETKAFEDNMRDKMVDSFAGVIGDDAMPSGWFSVVNDIGDYLNARNEAVRLNNPELLNPAKYDNSVPLNLNKLPFHLDSKGNKVITVYDASKGIGIESGYVKDKYGNDIIYSQNGKSFKETYSGDKKYVN
jgi:RHS repeat-associated protein